MLVLLTPYMTIRFFKSRPASLYREVKMIRVQTLKLLFRTVQSQDPTNLCRVEMDPVDFQMIFTHLEKASSGDPSIYELYIKNSLMKKADECMHGNKDDLCKLQKRKRKQHSKQFARFYVRAYTMEHMILLKTVFGYWFGIGARIRFPKPHATKVDEPGNYVTTDIILNIITDIPSTANFGPKITPFNTHGINGFALVYDQESYELTIKVRYGSLNYIEAKKMACYLQNFGTTAALTLV
jgi:hypothetical protein